MTDIMIARNLIKQYRKMERPALANVSCRIGEGEIVGLLGPNGAGKTTFVKLICGITTATKGELTVCGGNPIRNPSVKSRVAVVHQSAPMDQMLPAIDNVKIAAAFRGLKWRDVRKQVDSLFELFELTGSANKISFTLSGGQRRRLQLVRALLVVPQLLILDEPSAGLDVRGRRQMWELIGKYNVEHGTTIIWTSHYIEEIERNCERVVIIDKGRLVRDDSPAKLVTEFGQRSIQLHLPDADDYARMCALLPEDDVTALGGGRLSISGSGANDYLATIIDAVRDAACRDASIQFRMPSLEDAYVSLVGQENGQGVSA